MLVYSNKSWHYKLVLYVMSGEFFMETDGFDLKAMESQHNQTTKEEHFEIIYKKKPRTVNLCPYCRAVLASFIIVPFVYVWRLFPHKAKSKITHKQRMRRLQIQSWIARGIGASINFAFGIKNLTMDNNVEVVTGLIQIALGLLLLTGHLWIPELIRKILIYLPKRKLKPQKVKKESTHFREFSKKIQDKHDIICPPIFFVSEENPEELK